MFTVLVEIICGTCGVHHSLPKAMYDAAIEEGGYWYCPNGHQRGFREGKHEKEAIRRERDQLKQQVARLQGDISKERLARINAQQKVSKLHRRVSGGVCPCCNRTFQNLRRHMASKHPNVHQLEQKA